MICERCKLKSARKFDIPRMGDRILGGIHTDRPCYLLMSHSTHHSLHVFHSLQQPTASPALHHSPPSFRPLSLHYSSRSHTFRPPSPFVIFFFFLIPGPPPISPLFPYTPLFR